MTPTEVRRKRNVAVLGWDVADRLFPSIDPLERRIKIRGVPFRVVGVSQPQGSMFGISQDEFAIIPLGAFQRLFGSRSSLGLRVRPRDPEDVDAAISETTLALRIERRLKATEQDNFGILTSDTALGLYNQATTGIYAVLVGVVGLALVVAGIVIMNIMLMAVSERTKEIGLRKALGARRQDILHQMLAESVALSLLGGIAGTGLGACAALLLDRFAPGARFRAALVSHARPHADRRGGAVLRAVPGRPRGRARSDRGARPGRLMRGSLLREIVAMAATTVRTQKMRSALTILGVVIGITSIVGMTSLIRGFDESLRESIQELGPDTISLMQFGLSSFMAGADFNELLKRPTLTPGDARAIERQAESISRVVLTLGEAGGPGGPSRSRVNYRGERTAPTTIIGTTHDYPDVFHVDIEQGRFFTEGEVSHRRRTVVLGKGPNDALFPNIDPIGKTVRIANQPYTVVGVMGPRPGAGGFNADQDNFVVIPHTAYQKQFGLRIARMRRGRFLALTITAVPREGVARDDALRDVERVMRIRHGLRLDEPNDFDMLTQDAALRLWDRVSGATFLALVAISSIALLVGGIGVMAIMTISVTERTREIGTRKAIGARRREILWQFLLEASFLTGIGGVLGIILGSAIGLGVHYATGFPVSLPWWSFALGIGFSSLVGIVFGLFPAVRASSLDPIEALRYE